MGSTSEVDAIGNGGVVTFENALYVQFDGFIHTEIGGTPTARVEWADTNVPVPAADFTLVPGPRLQETYPGFADTPQRITFPFHVRFNNRNAYSTFGDVRQLRVTFSLGGYECTGTLDLTYSPNPYMVDINAIENNPAWLSTDVRVFSIEAGQMKFGDIFQNSNDPVPFIRRCLDKLNNPANNPDALFNALSTSATLDLAQNSAPPDSRPVYNYAIARVRYRAKTTTAQRVKCFFRMFNVAATGLEFDSNTTYRRTMPGPNTVPLIGVAGAEIVSIPFFASDRIETVQGRPGATSMISQTLDPLYEIRDLVPNPVGIEVTNYFGCWLDINQTRKRIPINHGGTDGPWPEAACRSIQELTRARHMCVVAEVYFDQDPTQPGETPESSDNLSQRNLAILHSDNPGGPNSHTVMHTFEVKPSTGPLGINLLQLLPGVLTQFDVPSMIAQRIYRLDELMFRWHNLPPTSEVTVYFSDIDTSVIRALGCLRLSPLPCEIIDEHTIRLTVGGATWIPIPGGRTLNVPALLSIKLPDDVVAGQHFRMSIHQADARSGRFIGACDFRIVVSKAALILPEEERTLSVFKHILSTVPKDNRWYPLLLRYVGHLGDKIKELGGDTGPIHGNPDGSGRPYDPPSGDSCSGVCRLLQCLLKTEGIQELLRRLELHPEEIRRCLNEYCQDCEPSGKTLRSNLPLPDRLRSILGDEQLLNAVLQELEKEPKTQN